MRSVDIAGNRFGRMVAIRDNGSSDGRRTWLCRCDCGAEKTVLGSDLRRGSVKSCGCLVVTHGRSRSSTYKSWQMMHQRCGNPANDNYRRYGARGVTVCPRWDAFEAFLSDMGERPAGTSLDRRDSAGHYEPDNCRWATRRQQNINTTRWAGYLDIDDRRVSMREMAHALAMPEHHLYVRLARLAR